MQLELSFLIEAEPLLGLAYMEQGQWFPSAFQQGRWKSAWGKGSYPHRTPWLACCPSGSCLSAENENVDGAEEGWGMLMSMVSLPPSLVQDWQFREAHKLACLPPVGSCFIMVSCLETPTGQWPCPFSWNRTGGGCREEQVLWLPSDWVSLI